MHVSKILGTSRDTFIYNPWQNIWHEVEKSSKIVQDFKSLLSNFARFLRAIVKL